MNYLLTENEALSFLNDYYNFDVSYIQIGTKQQTDKKETRGRKPLSCIHNLPLLYWDNDILMPAPFDDLVNGLIHVYSEEGNTRPYLIISKLITITSVIDEITVTGIKALLRCSNKTASRYYNFIVLLSKTYHTGRNNKLVINQ